MVKKMTTEWVKVKHKLFTYDRRLLIYSCGYDALNRIKKYEEWEYDLWEIGKMNKVMPISTYYI